MMDAASRKHSQDVGSYRAKLAVRTKRPVPRLTLNAFSIFWSFCLVHDLHPDALFPLRPSLAAALSDSQSNSLLNGNFVVAMFKREINFKGTIIEYSGSDTKVERINCTERIEEELILQVREKPFGLLCSAVIYCLLH